MYLDKYWQYRAQRLLERQFGDIDQDSVGQYLELLNDVVRPQISQDLLRDYEASLPEEQFDNEPNHIEHQPSL